MDNLKLLLDKAYITNILCDLSYNYYNFINNCIMLPTILGSSILTIMNSSEIDVNKMKIIKFLEKNHEQILYIALVLFVVVSFTTVLLSIYVLLILNVSSQTKALATSDNLPKDLSKKICADVYVAVSSISFTVNGEEFDRLKDFVKFIKCNFLTSDKETYMLIPSGGWIFKIKGGNEQPSEIKSG